MIPKDFITEWRDQAPWAADAQVEQDLIICRAVVEIFKTKDLAQRLAWRGGTALFKLHLRSGIRYSEDIDLVQISSESIGEIFDTIREVLDPWLGSPRRVLKKGRIHLIYRYDSEELPPKPMRLKIEINSREHFTELGHARLPFEVHSRWWKGSATVTTFALDELLGTKLRALYQRKKGRDLFDLWFAMTESAANEEGIVKCFERYMEESNFYVSRAQFEKNLTRKLLDPIFRAGMTPLLRPGIVWDLDRAGAFILEQVIARLPGEPWRSQSE